MRFGVLVFPGSSGDQDCHYVISEVLGRDVEYVWHGSSDVSGFDCLVLPGGCSYGDYQRSGAIASLSPVMKAVEKFSAGGGYVIGIGNGFQVLCEAGLLPGTLIGNAGARFVCRSVDVRVETASTPWTSAASSGELLRIPIAHASGNYQVETRALEEMKRMGQVVLRYCAPDGSVTPESNPNGSAENIAGVCNREGNVMGMMPRPERASEEELGSRDGLVIWNSLLSHCGAPA